MVWSPIQYALRRESNSSNEFPNCSPDSPQRGIQNQDEENFRSSVWKSSNVRDRVGDCWNECQVESYHLGNGSQELKECRQQGRFEQDDQDSQGYWEHPPTCCSRGKTFSILSLVAVWAKACSEPKIETTAEPLSRRTASCAIIRTDEWPTSGRQLSALKASVPR